VLYGKQTDQPARVLILAHKLPSYSKVVEQVLAALQLGPEMEDADVQLDSDYAEFLRRPHVIVGDAQARLTLLEQGQQLTDDFLNAPLALLDGQSPLEAAGDQTKSRLLRGLLCHMEGEQSLLFEGDAIGEIYRRLNFERPIVQVDPSADSLRLAYAVDMDRLAPSQLNDKQLKGLLIRAMSIGALRVFYRCATVVGQRPSLREDLQLQVAAISGMLNVEPDLERKLDMSRQLEELLVKLQAPVGRILIQRLSLLQALGRTEEAKQTIQQGLSKYPNDPYLISFVQYAMQAQSAAPVDDSGLAMRMMQNAAGQPASDPSRGSGLVLPGQQTDGVDGENKLWLPGS